MQCHLYRPHSLQNSRLFQIRLTFIKKGKVIKRINPRFSCSTVNHVASHNIYENSQLLKQSAHCTQKTTENITVWSSPPRADLTQSITLALPSSLRKQPHALSSLYLDKQLFATCPLLPMWNHPLPRVVSPLPLPRAAFAPLRSSPSLDKHLFSHFLTTLFIFPFGPTPSSCSYIFSHKPSLSLLGFYVTSVIFTLQLPVVFRNSDRATGRENGWGRGEEAQEMLPAPTVQKGMHEGKRWTRQPTMPVPGGTSAYLGQMGS